MCESRIQIDGVAAPCRIAQSTKKNHFLLEAWDIIQMTANVTLQGVPLIGMGK